MKAFWGDINNVFLIKKILHYIKKKIYIRTKLQLLHLLAMLFVATKCTGSSVTPNGSEFYLFALQWRVLIIEIFL